MKRWDDHSEARAQETSSAANAHHGSGLHLRADHLLLTAASRQIVSSFRLALLVCDARNAVLASTRTAEEHVRRFAGMAPRAPVRTVPESLAAAARRYVARASTDPSSAEAVVRRGHDGSAFAIYALSLANLAPAELAIALCPRASRRDAETLPLHERYLTAREQQLTTLVRRGLSNQEIATELGLTEGTVKVYLHRLFTRLRVKTRTQLVAMVDDMWLTR